MNAAVNTRECCDNKCDDVCFSVSDPIVSDALYAGLVKLSDNSILKELYARNGYAKAVLCKDIEQELTRNVDVLERYINTDICLCPDEINIVVENILKYADMSCCRSAERKDVEIDSSGYNQWVLANPNCDVYEAWETAYLGICTEFKFGNVFVQETPKLMFDLAITPVQNKCDLIMAISVQNEECKNPEIGIKISEIECKLDHDILVKNNNNCELSFDSYVRIIECGVKPDVVSKLVECGFKLEPNIEKKSCDIILDAKTKITLCDYKFSLNNNPIGCELASQIFGVQVCK